MPFTTSQATSILTSIIKSNGTYVGLHNGASAPAADGSGFVQPSASTGYEKPLIGTLDTSKVAQIANQDIIFFNETLGGGYGTVTHFGLFSSASDTVPFFVGELTTPLDIGAGYVPIFRAHQLVIGLDKGALESYG